MSAYLHELRQRNDDVARIQRLIDNINRMNRALRQVYDERTAIGGGSRTRIGELLGIAEDASHEVAADIRHFALDYTVREARCTAAS